MSKPGMKNVPMKHDSPFRKDNRPQNSSVDKRSPGNVKQERPMGNRSAVPERERQHSHSHSHNQRNNQEKKNTNENHGQSEMENDTDKSKESGEKKFTGRCRLFVGNLTPDVNEDVFRKMFEPFGEISEVYVNNQRAFGFIRLDYRQNAEAAKAALDGTQRKGRILRVRFATHGAALKVKNLHSYVSNELLEHSFSQFGDLERCVVIVDDRGKSTGEGIVEFVRKPGANSALRRITEGVFLMGADPRPVAVEPLEQKDEEDGMPEKFLTRTEQYKKEREKEPRFAPPGTFEYEFGMRWKAIEDLEKQRIDQVKKDTEKARIELEEEMQNALYDYQAEQIRQDLLRQQEELRRLEELRSSERMRRQQEMEMRRQKEEVEMVQQEERRRELMIRQQDIIRGRMPMDGSGMRQRDEMMMADRFRDRMGDRMPDRMGDRMGQDRMGQGGPGFNMWKEEQLRNEAQMGGRGNESPNRGIGNQGMRGPGGPGPQGMQGQQGQGNQQGPQGNQKGPQPGAQSGIDQPGQQESAPGAQNKDQPKPLMPPGPGFNNSGPGNNGPNNPNQGPEANMDVDACINDAADQGSWTKYQDNSNDNPPHEDDESPYPTIKESSPIKVIPEPPWCAENPFQASDLKVGESSVMISVVDKEDSLDVELDASSDPEISTCDVNNEPAVDSNSTPNLEPADSTDDSTLFSNVLPQPPTVECESPSNLLKQIVTEAQLSQSDSNCNSYSDENKLTSTTTSYCNGISSYQTASPSPSKQSDSTDSQTCENEKLEKLVESNLTEVCLSDQSHPYFTIPPSLEQKSPTELSQEIFHDKCTNSETCGDQYQFSNYISSYKQNLFGNPEDMDIEEIDNQDTELRTADSNVYQSYDSSNCIPIVTSIQDSSAEQATSNSSQITTNTHSSNAQCHVDNSNLQIVPHSTNALSTTSSHSPPVEQISTHDEVFRTGDQNFKSPPCSSTPLASSNTSSTATSCTPSMISSTMQYAQHNGATVMQTRTVRGNVTQATVLQKQPLPNGGQTMVQQRTITNGGHTMLVQQHTMTNRLGGITQQTVVQQRLIPTANIAHAQAAALHASSLRQQAIASQHAAAQATVLQQQRIRAAHGIVGNAVYQASPLGRTVLSATPPVVGVPSAQGPVMQRLIRQRYLGGPVLHPVRGVQMVAGRPIRIKMAYGSNQVPTG